MDDPKLQILLDRLIPALKPEAIYLFGSRARGDARPDSDYDLLVVTPDDIAKTYKSRRDCNELISDIKIEADIFPIKRKKFDIYQNYLGTMANIVKREGIQVYG